MSDYTKITNFAVKDTLTTGDPDKLIMGEEIDDEFDAIATAVASKLEDTRAAIGSTFRPVSDAESDEAIVPTLFYEDYGDVFRYGAAGDDSTDDKTAFQSAQDISRMTLIPDVTFSLLPSGTSPFNYSGTALPVYRAVTVDQDNLVLTGWGATVHAVNRVGAGATDIQPVFTSAQNTTVGTLANMHILGVTVDLENDGETNTNQRGYYLMGIDGLNLLSTTCKSSGTKRGYFAHIQNCRNVQAIGNKTDNTSGGLNFHYIENAAIVGHVSDGFNEAFDLQTYCNRVAMSGLVFNGGHGAAQCLDINGAHDVVATGIAASDTGNVLRVNFFGTNSSTFANFLAGVTTANTDPTSRIIVSNLAGSDTGDLGTADNLVAVGNDWSSQPHNDVGPVSDILLSGWMVKDTTMMVFWEGRRITLRDINLTNVASAASYYAVDLKSQFSSDQELTNSDMDCHIDNLTINGCNRGGLRVDAPRRCVLLGIRTRDCDSAATGDQDLKIGNMARRGTDAMMDYCDIQGDVSVSGDSTVISTWAGTTAYVVNKMIKNGTRFYRCITAGTSAGAGGPTTTAADITDGTVHWEYCAEPFRLTWGKNNKVGGQVLFTGDSHNYVHGQPMSVVIGDLAATGTVSRPVYHATRRCYIPRASVIAAASVTPDAGNFRSFTIKSVRDGVTATVQAITTASTGLTAFTARSLGFAALESDAYLEPGDTLYFETAHSGTGVAVTGLNLNFEILEM